MKDSTMTHVRQIAEQIKVSYDDMQITNDQLKNLADKYHEQRKRFLECCSKLKEILNSEDSV